MRLPRLLLRAALLLVAAHSASAQTPPAAARAALLQGRVAEAERLLRADLARSPANPGDLLLLCRTFYAQDRFSEAQESCDRAAAAAPANSEIQLWLGRVLGARASAANPLQAFALARKVHAAFERAVALDPKNVAAMNDLGEYYVGAPAIIGGGLDKARLLAPRLLAQDPIRGHRLLAQIAHKAGDTAAAERESEAAAAGNTPAGLIDLAIVRKDNRQPDLAVDAALRSIAHNRDRDNSLVDAAGILTTLHREPQRAASALRSYLDSPARSDAAPAFKVRLQLADLLRGLGDTAGADREAAVAATLAPGYGEGRKVASAH